MARLLSIFLLTLLFAGCAPELEPPQIHQGQMDLSNVVMIGGNYLAGYQDGALSGEGQENSIGYLLGKQLYSVNGQDFQMPWMPAGEGLGLNSTGTSNQPFQTRSHFGLKMACDSSTSNSVLKDTFGYASATTLLAPGNFTSINNFAVPFLKLNDLNAGTFNESMLNGGYNPYYHRFSSSSGGSSTYIDQIKSQDISFYVMWTGMEDLYEYIFRGASGQPLSASAFKTGLRGHLSDLKNKGGKGVLANIPSIHSLPFFSTIPWNPTPLDSILADSLTNIYQTFNIDITFQEGQNGLVIEDPNATGGFRLTKEGEYVCLNLPLDSVRCFFLGVLLTPVPDRYILTSDEIVSVETMIAEYNQAIDELGSEFEVPVVDVHSFMQNVENGFIWDGVEFNSEFVSGGFFSLDGQTPSPKGAALLTNEFIRVLNEHYEAAIPPVLVDDYSHVLWP